MPVSISARKPDAAVSKAIQALELQSSPISELVRQISQDLSHFSQQPDLKHTLGIGLAWKLIDLEQQVESLSGTQQAHGRTLLKLFEQAHCDLVFEGEEDLSVQGEILAESQNIVSKEFLNGLRLLTAAAGNGSLQALSVALQELQERLALGAEINWAVADAKDSAPKDRIRAEQLATVFDYHAKVGRPYFAERQASVNAALDGDEATKLSQSMDALMRKCRAYQACLRNGRGCEDLRAERVALAEACADTLITGLHNFDSLMK